VNQFHQSSLYESRETKGIVEGRRLAAAIMLPFEVLNRQRWAAPWNPAQR
jgi:hypothetical protein